MKVLHVITGLNNGGGEGVLYRVCKHDNRYHHESGCPEHGSKGDGTFDIHNKVISYKS